MDPIATLDKLAQIEASADIAESLHALFEWVKANGGDLPAGRGNETAMWLMVYRDFLAGVIVARETLPLTKLADALGV